MATTATAVLQFKRGTAARWSEVNPVLAAGEPGYEYNTNRIKIGDGVTAWNDLPYAQEDYIVNADTRSDFPAIGKANVIYKAEQEKVIYQWNTKELRYESLSNGNSFVPSDIQLINGGNAI